MRELRRQALDEEQQAGEVEGRNGAPWTSGTDEIWSLDGANMHYLVIGLLITLAACEPYRGSVSATPRWSENCGTPDAPKRCPSYRQHPPQQVSAPLPDYN